MIKLIYKEENGYVVRRFDGSMQKVFRKDAKRLSRSYNVPIGESVEIEPRDVVLDWSNGIRK